MKNVLQDQVIYIFEYFVGEAHMDGNHPVLSVIVPIYNVEKYLDRCIASIVGQTYENLEIILVNDGSGDRCKEICGLWEKRDSRIKVLHKKNQGLVSARQAGLAMASGRYIANVDGDDWIETDMYECLMDLALKSDADMVTSGLIRDYENHWVAEEEKVPAGNYRGEDLCRLLHQVIDTDHFFDSRINMHITNKVFKKEILMPYQMQVPMDAKVGEDADVVYPYIFGSSSICVSGQCFYHYVMRNDSIMGAADPHVRSKQAMEEIFERCIRENKGRVENIGGQLSQVLSFFACMSDPKSIFRMENGKLHPFEQVNKGDEVILYGAGRFGKAVRRLLEDEDYCLVKAWADKVEGNGVIGPREIRNYEFDKLILAVINAAVADDAERMLIHQGIEKEKICRISPCLHTSGGGPRAME